ncbi:hypothetical protein [Photobacterium satsumensis]|uniref:hypothetical protein n=1 Tax=Photobacterium satsumensis TaxID=2910239 RepID=UPI003D0AFDF1
MEIEHIGIQRKRLEKHYQFALNDKDEVSFLDLAHVLRVWVDMKKDVDFHANKKALSFKFKNYKTTKKVKNVLKGSKYTFLPLASGVDSPDVQVKAVQIIDRALTADEVKALFEAGPPIAHSTKLTFSEWLASGVYEVPANSSDHQTIRISREMLIKRVANMLGASHPAGTEVSDDIENKFDSYVLELHNLQVSNGYPATYYQLLEIAKDILDETIGLVD